ncbi:MAG: DMT family transporter [Planktomarina sp.]|nr:EamA family transporter [Planktomarina sp.]MDV3050737.1 DMT family transporter [Planktomarina sp.]|tara:strand:+ start:721 stop:1602 length:882 start_codon:yes stop_codon:yes gene_type:complete
MLKKHAVLLILSGGTFMSFVGLYMRLLSQADGFQILFFRSLSLCLIVLMVCCLRRKVTPLMFLKSIDKNDFLIGSSLSLAFVCYVFAMLYTTVASTLLILSATPFIAAIIGWLWINERPRSITWIAMAFAMVGIYFMVRSGYQLGNSFGNLLALLSGFWFALMLVMARHVRKNDILGGTFVGGAICIFIGAIMALIFGTGLKVTTQDLLIILGMGAFGIGIGITLVTWGASHVPAAEVSILVLIESVLGPVWPWLFLNEAMTLSEILGGTLVLGSVVVFAIFSIRTETNSPQN